MRKNVKNDKVLRAITIGLATMIATTSTPLTVLAEENEGTQEQQSSEANNESPSTPSAENTQETPAPPSENDGQQQSNTEQPPAEQPSAENNANEQPAAPTPEGIKEEVTQQFASANEAANDSAQAIADAAESISQLADDTATNPFVLSEITNNLNTADDYVDDTQVNLQDARTDITNALVNTQVANQQADASITVLENNLSNITTNETQTEIDTQAAIDNASTANNATTKEEAQAAKDSAQQNLDAAKTNLTDIKKDVEKAIANEEKARQDYEAAVTVYEKSLVDIQNAEEELKNAKNNSEQAKKNLEEAKKNAENLKQKAEENKASLEAMQTQNEALLIQYYQEVLKDKAVYNTDGSINVEANAGKITPEQIDTKAKKPGDKVMYLGRDLMHKIVEYMIKNDENVDWDNAEFKFGEDGTRYQPAYQGKIFESGTRAKDEKGKDLKDEDGNFVYKQQVVVNEDRGNKDGSSTIKHNEDSGFNWILSNQKDGGRTNRVHVSYKDKNGVVHDEYYNYVFKNSKDDDISDFKSGPIYLGLIKEDATTGKWSVVKVSDNQNYDNYQDLLAAVQSVEDISQYEAALKDVENAEAEVKRLQDEIDKLKNTSIDSTTLNTLKQRLTDAQDSLANVQDKAAELEDAVEKAEEIVNSINNPLLNETEDEKNNGNNEVNPGTNPAAGAADNNEASSGEESGGTETPAAEVSDEGESGALAEATSDDESAAAITPAAALGAASGSESTDDNDTAAFIESVISTVTPTLGTDISLSYDAPATFGDYVAATPATGVAGVRVSPNSAGVTVGSGTGNATASTENGTGAATTNIARPTGVAGVRVTPPAQKQPLNEDTSKKIVRIEDNEVPKAPLPEMLENEHHSIMWWIFIGWLLLLIAYITNKLLKKEENINTVEAEDKKEQQ